MAIRVELNRASKIIWLLSHQCCNNNFGNNINGLSPQSSRRMLKCIIFIFIHSWRCLFVWLFLIFQKESVQLNILIANRALVAEWVNVSINHNPMLKIEGSNLGASILKFGLFQFSKWLCSEKNNNLGISVELLVLNDWTQIVLQFVLIKFHI